ncbi:hypothetical protein B0T25DRAFT_566581 [Lasiosphaeria hispida]|uniref:MYND-type domain-containing protein n=1 Tax=Lasiosphaeria hispida TaxID=260671 RepID=A0AAJ0MG10_9PEZI|nr:hypothetical protein B0T25DRAFT_566581 [Lasiosphaeria hispida]
MPCVSCNKSPPEVTLKNCAKCRESQYCSRDYQEADWKTHNVLTSSGTRGATKGLDGVVSNPFTRLDNGTYLQNRSETDVFRLVVDSYRLRLTDDGLPPSPSQFGRHLRLAESRAGMLPSWWNAIKAQASANFGSPANTSTVQLTHPVFESDIIEHYGNSEFPMQLRMLAEAICGSSPAGQDGTMMRKMLAGMEGLGGTV